MFSDGNGAVVFWHTQPCSRDAMLVAGGPLWHLKVIDVSDSHCLTGLQPMTYQVLVVNPPTVVLVASDAGKN